MDDVQDFSALDARLLRKIRQPVRYEDYETDLPRLEVHSMEDEGMAPPFGATYILPPSFEHNGERSQGYAIPLRSEREEMQRERLQLQALHASMQKMLNRFENLQLHPPPTATAAHGDPNPREEEEDQPLSPAPVVFREVSSQDMGRESLATQQSCQVPSPQAHPWPKLVSTPVPPPRAKPPPNTTSTPVPPPGVHLMPAAPEQLPPSDLPWRVRPAQGLLSPVVTPEAYRRPRPSIPKLTRKDPGEFFRLKMALNNLLPPESSELFKYQVLLDHLHLEEAKLIADACIHSTTPFSDTMHALNKKLGRPHQLALRKIGVLTNSPDICQGDVAAFEWFSHQVQSLVGMLKTFGPHSEVELQRESHVIRLLSKLPPEQRAEFRRCMFNRSSHVYTLDDLATWLKYESWCQDFDGLFTQRGRERPDAEPPKHSTSVLRDAESPVMPPGNLSSKPKQHTYCAYCASRAHHVSQCPDVSKLSQEQLTDWIKANNRCWRCARSHQAAQCNLRKPCSFCQGRHLRVLHHVNSKLKK
ncbi:unnamed protein product [Ophioblennius macclurei]